ncbi:MAG: sugar phosphate nucleotidyltransferase, partial [Limnospira sp. PMC 894.15]|uniref:sugar phosphate nucleotidyltransferase n=1 Tax=Limnospira sp. PMC 894.15 TaxID=2981100 RepID=UPI0028E15C5B
TDMDYSDLWRAHQAQRAIATIATCRKRVPIALGVLDLNEDGDLTGYTEKPTLEYRVSMGMYVFQRRITEYIKRDQYLDLPDLMKRLLAAGERIHCYDFRGRWLDIGNPDDYALANEQVADNAGVFVQGPQAR